MGISFRLRSVVIIEIHRVAVIFCLQLIAAFCLCVTIGQAASNYSMGDNHILGYSNKSDLLAQSEYPALDEESLGDGKQPQERKETVEPVTRKVPIWGEKLREMGYDLPLPFGVGGNFTLMDQGIDIRNLKIGIGDPNLEPVDITFKNARSRDTAETLRLDIWLLPIANFYGLFGYIDGSAELDINLPGLSIDVPGLGPLPILPAVTVPLDVDYDGTTYGGGITLAGGYKNFFGSLDANYTYSEINVVDGEIETVTISPRLGVMVDPAAIRGSFAFWIGAMYMDYKQTIADDINLREIDPRLPSVDIEFELDLKNDEPWNFLFGGQWEITKRWQFMVEGGIGDRKQFITGLFFRF